MKKALTAVAIFLILACTLFTMISCDHNVYIPENNTWSVRDMYFNTFGEALDWLIGQIGGRSRDIEPISSDIPEDLTIHLMRSVGRDENAKAIIVPSSFSGSLCIDFQGFEYWFSSKEELFFDIQGGDRIDIINGKTIIPEDTRSDTKAVKVNVNVVTIDDHLVIDRRTNPQAVEVGPKGVLVIKSTSDNRTEGSLGGAFDIQAGGALRINGGVVRIESIDNPTDGMNFTIGGGNISSPHEIANYVEAAIEAGGNADNVETDIIHDINDVWISIDPEKHYRTCNGCDNHFDEAEHVFTEWIYDETTLSTNRQCIVCGRVESTAHQHVLEFHAAKEPTCTEPGNIAYYGCDICGKKFLDADGKEPVENVVLTKPHTLTHTAAVAATCTEAGNIEYWYCEECKQYFTNEACTAVVTNIEVPATGHVWGEWTVVKAATCTEAGLERRVCTNDAEHTEEKTIEALGHELTAHEAKAATCTEAGNSAYWECSRCGKYFSDAEAINIIEKDSWIIPAAGHAWKEEWTTDNLYHWHVCTTCGEINDKAEHTLGEWTYNPETGKMDNECSVCHKDFHQDHVHNEFNLTYHPTVQHTCTENGTWDYYECSECGKKFKLAGITFVEISDEDIIDPASHKLTKIPAVAATCETDGNIDCWICDVCDKLFSDAAGKTEITLEESIISKTGHDYGDWIIEAEATCIAAGSKYRICANDNSHIEREEIPAKGHTMSALIAEVPATCEEDGTKAHYHCSTCNKDFEDAEGATEITDLTIPALGHQLTAVVAHEATCTAAGNSAYWYCSRCESYFSDAECTTEIEEDSWIIPAKGHTYGDWTVVTEPTCVTPGLRQRVCSVDGFIEQEEIPAAGQHTLTAHAAVAATCTATGNSAYWECTACGKYFSDEACEHEIAANSWITEKIAHTLTHFAAVDPTCTEDGNIEYWRCNACHKYFSDEACEHEIEEEDTVIDATGHTWSEEWTSGLIDEEHYHWHVCTVCEAIDEETKAACTPIYQHDENQHWQICEICGAQLTEKTDHVWGDEIKHDDEKDLDYVECECGERLYDELYEVTIGEVTATYGTDAPAGTMQVEIDEEENTVTVSYVPEEDETPELRCKVYVDGVWSGSYHEQQQDGSFQIAAEQGKSYKVMLEAENETGMTVFEKIIGVVNPE